MLSAHSGGDLTQSHAAIPVIARPVTSSKKEHRMTRAWHPVSAAVGAAQLRQFLPSREALCAPRRRIRPAAGTPS